MQKLLGRYVVSYSYRDFKTCFVFLLLKHISTQFGLATFEVFCSYLWLVAAILDSRQNLLG